MRPLFKTIFCLLFLLFFAACDGGGNLAPVTELHQQSFSRTPQTHTVRRGETLYAIAFGYDTDFKTLAQLNHLNPPYQVQIGQVLRLRGSAPVVFTSSRQAKAVYRPPTVYVETKKNSPTIVAHQYNPSGWYWPVHGRLISSFIPSQGKKGINIASQKGEAVHAALSGVVAYAGNGLTGYGNLIIIKHNNEYLTAYGNNAKVLVSEGQKVKTGQVIAQVGVLDHKYWGVHFEIRKQGVPVNPLNYLK